MKHEAGGAETRALMTSMEGIEGGEEKTTKQEGGR